MSAGNVQPKPEVAKPKIRKTPERRPMSDRMRVLSMLDRELGSLSMQDAQAALLATCPAFGIDAQIRNH